MEFIVRGVREFNEPDVFMAFEETGEDDLEVIDIYQQPVLAEGEQIIAAPTLVKKLPLPLRRFIGDMSDTERILVGMDLRTAEEQRAAAKRASRP